MVHPGVAIVSSAENTCRKLKARVLHGERSRSEKAACCAMPTLGHSVKGNPVGTVKREGFARGPREGGMSRWNRGCLGQGNHSV